MLPIELLEMGRHYPLGYPHFRQRLREAFTKEACWRDFGKVHRRLEQAAYVKRGMPIGNSFSGTTGWHLCLTAD